MNNLVKKSFVLIAVVGLFSSFGSKPATARSLAIFHSSTLKIDYCIDQFYFPGYGRHWAVSIVGIDSDSPLREIGMRRFDIITRLDNVRVTTGGQLKNHRCWTSIRFFRGRDGDDVNRTVFNKKFHISH